MGSPGYRLLGPSRVDLFALSFLVVLLSSRCRKSLEGEMDLLCQGVVRGLADGSCLGGGVPAGLKTRGRGEGGQGGGHGSPWALLPSALLP